jgi:hypothetical protein
MPVIYPSYPTSVGPFSVLQPLPGNTLSQVGPFVLIHHGTSRVAPGTAHRISPHPHRGFSPVTLVFQGEILHKDSAGHSGEVQAGGAQWLEAGSGVIHSEGPSAGFSERGGTIEIVQIWINVPAASKMNAPRYFNFTEKDFPRYHGLSIAAGQIDALTGPAEVHSPLVVMFGEMNLNQPLNIPVPKDHESLVYVLEGEIASGGITCPASHMMVFPAGESPAFSITQSGKMVFLSGKPLQEPVVSYGPFVMNTHTEIHQAILDFQSGAMGNLDS